LKDVVYAKQHLKEAQFLVLESKTETFAKKYFNKNGAKMKNLMQNKKFQRERVKLLDWVSEKYLTSIANLVLTAFSWFSK
jgi:hypothetical protein